MTLKTISWSDFEEIVEALLEEHISLNDLESVRNLNFTTLRQMVLALENFEDDMSCNEKKLERIQELLIEELE
jgi:FeS assembly protein IscX